MSQQPPDTPKIHYPEGEEVPPRAIEAAPDRRDEREDPVPDSHGSWEGLYVDEDVKPTRFDAIPETEFAGIHDGLSEPPWRRGTRAFTPGTAMPPPSEEQAGHPPGPVAGVPGLNLGPNPMKIGLWGSPQSGKTTYLAALRHAVALQDPRHGKARARDVGDWRIYPMSTHSAQLLADFTHQLNQRSFPQANLPGERPIPLEWAFVGDLRKSRFARRSLLRRGPDEVRFLLDLIDVSGTAFAHDPELHAAPAHVVDEALGHLTAAKGLIYLFDPIGERDNRDSSSYVNRTITELLRRTAARGQFPQHLNQQISVCVTKFDNPSVFQAARDNGYVNFGSDGMPRVLDEQAEDFFDLLCTDKFWSTRYEQGVGSAQWIRNELRNVFGTENIRYFVTTSIGFYLKNEKFDPEDFGNFREAAGGVGAIRGAVNPINVIEPLISLQQRLAGRS